MKPILILRCIVGVLLSLVLKLVHAQVSLNLQLMNNDGTFTAADFSYSEYIDPEDDQLIDLKLQIDRFCTSLQRAPHSCAVAMYEEFQRLHALISPWLSEYTILNSFSHNLASQYCSTIVNTNFTDADECYNNATAAIRSVKMYNSFMRVRSLTAAIDQNTLVPMPPHWTQGIEGHTFLYADKVRIMQELADDARVERVCEIGFNMGHSVRQTHQMPCWNAPNVQVFNCLTYR